jgi:hypothetical protein
MDKLELVRSVASPYAALPNLSPHQVPTEMPEAQLLHRQILQELVRGGPCHIRAIYHPDFGLLMDDSLNLTSSLRDQSIVFHELVHHAQHVSAKFGELRTPCERRAVAELLFPDPTVTPGAMNPEVVEEKK